MSIAEIQGFENYTPEIVTELRHMFSDGKIESRPFVINNTAIWVDANELLHRENGLPAVERSTGEKQYWTHGTEK